MARLVYVVRRDQQSLYDYLRKSFEGEADVEIILDRRWTERRWKPNSVTPARAPEKRREGDRRVRQQIEDELRDLGYAIVILKDES